MPAHTRNSRQAREPGRAGRGLPGVPRPAAVARPAAAPAQSFGRRGVRPPPLAAVPFGCTLPVQVLDTRIRVSI